MATLHMICGLPGSGKSTLAEKLEREFSALRLVPDDWMIKIVGTLNDEARRDSIEKIQMQIAERVLQLGIDVVLESGFWSKRERAEVRERIEHLGGTTKLYYLAVSCAELKRRIERRNSNLPSEAWWVDPEKIEEWMQLFEVPTEEEINSNGQSLFGNSAVSDSTFM